MAKAEPRRPLESEAPRLATRSSVSGPIVGQPMRVDKVWYEMLSRKVAAADQKVLAAAFVAMLAPFSGFRDAVDVDFRLLLSGELSKEERKRVIELLILFLNQAKVAADLVFPQAPERAIIVDPVELWQGMLLDVHEGSQNAWTDLLARRRGDRTDHRRMRLLKENAARAYRVLRSVRIPARDATESINAVIRSHARVYKRKLPSFTEETLREWVRRIAVLDDATTKEIIAKAVPNIGVLDLKSLTEKERQFLIGKPIARYFLSHPLENMRLCSTRD